MILFVGLMVQKIIIILIIIIIIIIIIMEKHFTIKTCDKTLLDNIVRFKKG